jgi:uncharacterized protein YdaU (DUF1376 family)
MKEKDPAFLFYPADFLIGCADLTNEEVGIYIKLLCLQHQKGHLNQKIIRLFFGFDWFSFSNELRAKFKEDKDGLIFNSRLDREIEKRAYHFDYHRENGKKGGRPKNQNNNQYNNQNETKTITKTKASRDENENINEDENVNTLKGGTGGKVETPNVENHCTEGEDTFCEVLDELSFESVWVMYGRKGNKKSSQRRWDGLPKKAKLLAVAHIPRYVAATPEIQYRKNFETYINQEAWNDQIITKNGTERRFTSTENANSMGNSYSGNGANTFRTDAERRRNERQVLAQMATAVLQQPETKKD